MMTNPAKFVVTAFALAWLAAAPGWAQDRVDLPDFASSFVRVGAIDANGLVNNDIVTLTIDGHRNTVAVAGFAEKIVITPNLKEFAAFATEIYEPDTIVRGSRNGNSSKAKQNNLAAAVIARGDDVHTTFFVSGTQVGGCTSKVKSLNYNAVGGNYGAANAVSSCSQTALEAMVPNAAVRTRLQQLFGTAAGGGLRAVSVNVPRT